METTRASGCEGKGLCSLPGQVLGQTPAGGSGASTPSLAKAEGEGACSEAGGQGATWAAAGEVLGHKGTIIPSGTWLLNGTFIGPARSTRPNHPPTHKGRAI